MKRFELGLGDVSEPNNVAAILNKHLNVVFTHAQYQSEFVVESATIVLMSDMPCLLNSTYDRIRGIIQGISITLIEMKHVPLAQSLAPATPEQSAANCIWDAVIGVRNTIANNPPGDLFLFHRNVGDLVKAKVNSDTTGQSDDNEAALFDTMSCLDEAAL